MADITWGIPIHPPTTDKIAKTINGNVIEKGDSWG
jgi:hypothetical protein